MAKIICRFDRKKTSYPLFSTPKDFQIKTLKKSPKSPLKDNKKGILKDMKKDMMKSI